MEQTRRSPESFLAAVDADRRDGMVALDQIIATAMSDRTRVLWEGTFWGGTEQTIIGYGDLVQPRPRGDDVHWFIVGLALQKRHFSVYVNTVADGAYLASSYADRLGKVKLGASSIGFTRLDDLDLDAFTELIVEANRISP